MLFWFLFYVWENQNTERLSNESKDTQAASGRAGIWPWALSAPKSTFVATPLYCLTNTGFLINIFRKKIIYKSHLFLKRAYVSKYVIVTYCGNCCQMSNLCYIGDHLLFLSNLLSFLSLFPIFRLKLSWKNAISYYFLGFWLKTKQGKQRNYPKL